MIELSVSLIQLHWNSNTMRFLIGLHDTIFNWEENPFLESQNFAHLRKMGAQQTRYNSIENRKVFKMIAASKDGKLRAWDLKTGTLEATLNGDITNGEDFITSVAYSDDCKSVASGSMDNTVKIWNLVTLTTETTLLGMNTVR